MPNKYDTINRLKRDLKWHASLKEQGLMDISQEEYECLIHSLKKLSIDNHPSIIKVGDVVQRHPHREFRGTGIVVNYDFATDFIMVDWGKDGVESKLLAINFIHPKVKRFNSGRKVKWIYKDGFPIE